jgi:hypothetical protein
VTLNLQQCNPNKPMTRCSTAQRAGDKLAKELLSLSFSFLMQSFILFESMPIDQNCHDTAGLLALGGYPDYVSIHLTSTKIALFSFFQKVLTPATAVHQGLPKFLRSQHSAGPKNTKKRDNRRRLCLDHAENLFIYLGLLYLHKVKRTMA